MSRAEWERVGQQIEQGLVDGLNSWQQVHGDHVHVECFVCGRAHVKGKDCEDACYG